MVHAKKNSKNIFIVSEQFLEIIMHRDLHTEYKIQQENWLAEFIYCLNKVMVSDVTAQLGIAYSQV